MHQIDIAYTLSINTQGITYEQYQKYNHIHRQTP